MIKLPYCMNLEQGTGQLFPHIQQQPILLLYPNHLHDEMTHMIEEMLTDDLALMT